MKEFKLSDYEARSRVLLFLKLRRGKTITEQTVKDFEKLLRRMWRNFKDHDESAYPAWRVKDNEAIHLALKAVRCQMMKWENGGNCRIKDIDNFSLYVDEKYRAVIKSVPREITERDFDVLKYVFFGEK